MGNSGTKKNKFHSLLLVLVGNMIYALTVKLFFQQMGITQFDLFTYQLPETIKD